MLTLPFVVYVPAERKVFDDRGMQRWFEPEHKLLFTLQFPDVDIPVMALGLWDGHREGRVGKIN